MIDQSITRTIARFVAAIVAICIYILNAIFTYTYGTTVIGSFLLVDYIGEPSSAILTGLVSVLFFDVSYLVGFALLLFACRSMFQYAAVTLQFTTCFLFSIGASIVSLILLSDLGSFVDPATLLTAQYAGYGMLIVGFIANAFAGIFYTAGSPENLERIKSSVRAAINLARQDRAEEELDRESEKLAAQMVREQMPAIALEKARSKLALYMATMGFEPNTLTGHPQSLPAGPPEVVTIDAEGHIRPTDAKPDPDKEWYRYRPGDEHTTNGDNPTPETTLQENNQPGRPIGFQPRNSSDNDNETWEEKVRRWQGIVSAQGARPERPRDEQADQSFTDEQIHYLLQHITDPYNHLRSLSLSDLQDMSLRDSSPAPTVEMNARDLTTHFARKSNSELAQQLDSQRLENNPPAVAAYRILRDRLGK